jgi:hypothetical protein
MTLSEDHLSHLFFDGFVLRTKRFYQCPESFGMIFDLEMADFMDNDVSDIFGRQVD